MSSQVAEPDGERLGWMYRQMLRIREFEERVKATFTEHPGGAPPDGRGRRARAARADVLSAQRWVARAAHVGIGADVSKVTVVGYRSCVIDCGLFSKHTL
jgi:hypothetical protein